MSTQFYAPPYNAVLPWKQFSIVYDGAYHYATQDIPASGPNADPTLQILYTITGAQRADDIVTVYFTQTGSVTNFAKGSIIKCAGMTDTSMNFTGMCVNGGSGFAQFISPGWDATLGASAGTVSAPNPAFTTGFFFTPTYTTKINTENKAIITQLGDSYSQRMPTAVNSFTQNMVLVFQNRSVREAKAIANYVQSTQGSQSFEVMLADPFLNNQPTQKFISAGCDVNPVSWNLADVTVNVSRVFEP